MEITDIRIFKANNRGAVLAYANIVLNDCFIIRGITLLETEKGRFVSMPSRRLKDKEKAYRDVCHPLNSETRETITKAIFEAYDEFLKTEEKPKEK